MATNMLKDKVAVLTGAASTLGRVIATRFVAQGARVILVDQAECRTLADKLNQGQPVPVAHEMKCDIRNTAKIEEAVKKAKDTYNRIDIFYNNADAKNVHSPNSSIDEIPSFDETMAVNVRSVIASIKYAGEAMRSSGNKDGVILCTGSPFGPHDDVVPSLYSISKAAAMGVVRAAAAELGSHGVRVNAISRHGVVGRFDIVVLKKMFPHASEAELQAIINSSGPNIVTDKHMANAAVFLASEKGKGINGQNFVLDGEFTL